MMVGTGVRCLETVIYLWSTIVIQLFKIKDGKCEPMTIMLVMNDCQCTCIHIYIYIYNYTSYIQHAVYVE